MGVLTDGATSTCPVAAARTAIGSRDTSALSMTPRTPAHNSSTAAAGVNPVVSTTMCGHNVVHWPNRPLPRNGCCPTSTTNTVGEHFSAAWVKPNAPLSQPITDTLASADNSAVTARPARGSASPSSTRTTGSRWASTAARGSFAPLLPDLLAAIPPLEKYFGRSTNHPVPQTTVIFAYLSMIQHAAQGRVTLGQPKPVRTAQTS